MNSIWWLLMFAIVLGCGADTQTTGPSDYDAGINLSSDGAIVDQSVIMADAQVNTDSITGRWAQKVILAGIAEVPVLGFQETDTIGLSLVKIEEVDGQLSASINVCQTLIQRPDDIVVTEIPNSFISSIPTYYRTIFRDQDGVYFSRLAELNGVRLSDVINEELPTSANDPRVFDQDEDGYPGVTVFVSGLISGKIYLIQRTVTQMEGNLENGRLIGEIDWSITESILGSDEEFLEMGAPLSPNPDRTRSQFELIRIAEDEGCEEIITSKAQSFTITAPTSVQSPE